MMSSEEDADCMALLEEKSLKAKKRVRQRVDAGEPRNSYASIPNFSSRPPPNPAPPSVLSQYHHNGFSVASANKMLCDLLGGRHHSKEEPSAMIVDSDGRGMNGTSPVALATTTPGRMYLNGTSPSDLPSLYASSRGPSDSPPTTESSSSSSSHLLRDILQGRKQHGGEYNGSGTTSPPGQHVLGPLLKGSISGGHGPETTPPPPPPPPSATAEGGEIPAGSRTRTPPEKADSEDSAESKASSRMSEQDAAVAARASPTGNPSSDGGLAVPSPVSSPTSRSCSPHCASATTPNSLTWQSSSANAAGGIIPCSNALEVKRARVETIVSNMLQGPTRPQGGGVGCVDQPTPVNGCKKRKLYQPQQHEAVPRPASMNGIDDTYDDEEDEDEDDEPASKRRNTELHTFRQQLRQMQQQLVAMQQQYMEMMDGDSTDEDESSAVAASPTRNSITPSSNLNHMSSIPLRPRDDAPSVGQRTPDQSDCEDHKPRLPDIKDSRSGLQPQSKTYLDYDTASMYDEQRRLVIAEHNEKLMSSREREERSASDDTIKSSLAGGLQEVRQSCIVRPPSHGDIHGPSFEVDWLVDSLKAELSSSLSQVIDSVVSRYVQRKSMTKVNTSDQEPPKDPTLLSQMLDRKSPRTKVIDRGTRVNGHSLGGLRTSPFPPDLSTVPKPPFFFPLKPPTSMSATAATAAFLYGSPPQLPPVSMPQPYHSPVHSTPTPHSLSMDLPEQTEAMSLVVTPKKKRHKVTDTRLNPRPGLGGRGGLGQEADTSPKYPSILGSMPPSEPPPPPHIYSHHPPPPPLVPVSLPTTVAIPNPSLNQSDLFHGFAYDPHRLAHYAVEPPDDDALLHSTPNSLHPLLTSHGHQRGSPDSLHFSHLKQDNGESSDPGDSPAYDSGMAVTSTLTPMHLRKAKLMFFYARYPSSAVLKMYFPDIKFNKNNTAQLVKWFSNFREFYYIQMEKYARQALSEGVKSTDDLKVTSDSELLRVLNLHYNRNNHIEAPEQFRYVVEQTLREFHKAITAGKDTEQSWKKSIYKVIARMDDNVPEYFKSPNFLETLE